MVRGPMELAERAVEAALAAGCDYADARANRLEREELGVRNDELRTADALGDFGLGVRVRKDGAWGFAAAPLGALDEVLAGTLGRRAAAVAGALAPARREPVVLAPLDVRSGEYTTPYETDPFAVPVAEKVGLLREACERMRGVASTVVREATFSGRREEQWQASSEGARIHQVLVRSGAGIACTAAKDGVVERRSHPASFGGNYKSAGWEHVVAQDLAGHGARVRDEAVALCSAPICPRACAR